MRSHSEIERKFLVYEADLGNVPDLYLSEIYSVYVDPKDLDGLDGPELNNIHSFLTPNHREIRVSRITSPETIRFMLTVKAGGHEIRRGEAEQEISEELFYKIVKKYGKRHIEKSRFTFEYLRRIFELDVIKTPHNKGGDGATIILEVELENENQMFALPPFVLIEKEVTGNSKFYNHTLAQPLVRNR